MVAETTNWYEVGLKMRSNPEKDRQRLDTLEHIRTTLGRRSKPLTLLCFPCMDWASEKLFMDNWSGRLKFVAFERDKAIFDLGCDSMPGRNKKLSKDGLYITTDLGVYFNASTQWVYNQIRLGGKWFEHMTNLGMFQCNAGWVDLNATLNTAAETLVDLPLFFDPDAVKIPIGLTWMTRRNTGVTQQWVNDRKTPGTRSCDIHPGVLEDYVSQNPYGFDFRVTEYRLEDTSTVKTQRGKRGMIFGTGLYIQQT